jgi:plasmid stabilization system protein ParE
MAEARQIIVRWSQEAILDDDGICEYLMTKASLEAADRWAKGLLAGISRLTLLPLSGKRVPKIRVGGEKTRQIVFGSYRVFCEYTPPHLDVLAIRHGARNIEQEEQL